jgi:hypothetical protein
VPAYAFPVLWAASNMRAAGAALVTANTLTAVFITLFLLLPPARALNDFLFLRRLSSAPFFGAVLVVMAVMLVRANATQERLVTALRAQITVDALTGLATRRAFDGALEKARADRSGRNGARTH